MNNLSIPFSAFWLRSSVVSILISLISDMWINGPHDIKLIFLRERVHCRSLLLGFSCIALVLHYCKGLLHPTQMKFVFFLHVVRSRALRVKLSNKKSVYWLILKALPDKRDPSCILTPLRMSILIRMLTPLCMPTPLRMSTSIRMPTSIHVSTLLHQLSRVLEVAQRLTRKLAPTMRPQKNFSYAREIERL
ncbi:hypothetical protein CR513_38618, partial [Mucuna pruriens]